MRPSTILFFHICGAILGLLAGWSAMIFRKGFRGHRMTGNVFFVCMLIMGGTGAYMGYGNRQGINVVVGTLTFYLVASAWATVMRKEGETGLVEIGIMLLGLADGAGAALLGTQAAHSATGLQYGAPAVAYYIFGSLALLGAVLDVRVLLRGGVSGAFRITRHLWRMCLALLIGTLSLFLGKQEHFPAALVKTHLLNIPILVVFGAMIYWIIRVRFTNAYKKRQPTLAYSPNAGD